MRIPEKAWADYVERLSRLNERAGQLMAQYIERHGTGDAAALADYAHALVVKYGEGNAELACQMYDAMAKAAGAAVPPAAPAEPAGYGEVARMVEAMRRSPPLLRGGVSRLVKRAGADTTLKNVQRDGAEFAWVPHGETVVLLSHKKADSYIHIDVEFGEGEGKIPVDSIAKRAEAYKPKEKVTYKMIKEYIEAKYGFKVHTAYIAEVKRNLGLPMYDAPNAVEELKQPRKHPTPEKVEAIKDALRYFAVI